jgi:hypothetical protein
MRKFPPQVETIIIERDSIREVIRDTTVYYPVPGDLRIDSIPVPIPCPELPYFDLSEYVLTQEVQFARAKSWLTMSPTMIKSEGVRMVLQMHMKLEQKEQEIEMHFKGVIRERDHWRYLYEKEVQKITVKEVGWWHKFASRFTLITMGLLGIGTFLKFKRIW